MANPNAQHFDLVVIGCGPGGYKTAITAAQLGAKVAIIEKSLPGGTCLNQGCVPKEALLKVARLLREAQALKGRGLDGELHGNFEAALKHQRDMVESIRSTLSPWLKQSGITLIKGEARFISRECIEVTTETSKEQINAKRFVIASGARPKHDPACPTNGKNILDSKQFMFNLQTLPRTVLCVGGGAIGTELGYMLHQFGAEVSIVERDERLLPKPCISERASNTLERQFKKLGVPLYKNCHVINTELHGDKVQVTLSNGHSQEYDCVLVAIGREPNSQNMGLENIGVDVDFEGFIKTNEFLETSVRGIYAVGDVKRGPMTANAAFHDAKHAAVNAHSGNQLKYNYNKVPIVIDSVLQLAAVGLSEDRAEDAGFEPDVARINLAGSTIARINHGSEGYIEVVHDEETGQLLGGSIVGPQAIEMIHMLTAACQSQRGLWFFTDMNYSHPSWNEELENAIARYVLAFNKSDEQIFRPGIYAIEQ